MKLYLASSFDLVDRVQSVAEALERSGHTIMVKWWAADGFNMWDKKKDYTSDAFYKDPICQHIFLKDLDGVRQADALVLVGGIEPMMFTGANVELGIAITLGKRCYSVGALKNSAMYYPVIKCKRVHELVALLEEAEG